jgi:ATP-dependent helicase/nuclease subunit B
MVGMELVTGPFRPGLEKAFQETFARLRGGDPLAPVAVIAPSRRLADHLRELAIASVPEGFAAVRFFNLFSFARAIEEEDPLPGSRLFPDNLVPSRLLGAILRRHYARERYLSRAAISPGSILTALHELKAAAVDPGKALEALAEEELGLEDSEKLAELLTLYKRYSDELRRRKIHVRPDIVRRAVERAPRSGLLGSLGHVIYYGSYDLDQNQADLLREVSRRVETTVFFPYVDRPEYGYAKETLQSTFAPVAVRRRSLPPAVPSPRIRQVSVSGAHDEVWVAAKEVLRFADQGVPYTRIGVVARTIEPYADLVDVLFREHSIPFVSSARRRLDRAPQVKAARLLFELEEFNRARVMDLLRSPYFKRAGGDPELWDQASRHLGIGHGAREWRRRLGQAAGKDFVFNRGSRAGEKGFVLPRAEVDQFWAAVSGLLDAPPPPAEWAAYSAWALDRYRRFLEPDPRVEAAIASLEDLAGLAMEDPGGTLLDLLSELTEPVGWQPGGKTGEGVRVLDVMAARGLSFQGLVVLGMNERIFPRFILEDPFLRDTVRSRLEHRLGCRMSRKLSGHEEEKLLFELVRGASDELVFCHQRSDEQGRLQIPSFLLPAGEITPIPRRPAERLRQAEFDLLTPREASIRTGEGEALGRALGRDVSMLRGATAFLEAVESRKELTRFDGLVDARAYWQAVASFGLSPSALERLAECPFRYFASRMLDLEPLDEPEGQEALSAVEIGQIYHDALERFHRGGDLKKSLEETTAAFEGLRSIRYPVLWEVEKARIAKVLEEFVRRDDVSVFKPREYEYRLEARFPLEVGGRKEVTLRGFVDRLDVAADGSFRVVDYKKSRKKYTWVMGTGVFEKGRYLQPPLYFMLASAVLGPRDTRRSRFSYYFIEEALKEEERWEMSLTGDVWAERRPEFEAHFRKLLETIPAGRFPIRPVDAYCRSCDFSTMCRKNHLPTRLRAEGDHESG